MSKNRPISRVPTERQKIIIKEIKKWKDGIHVNKLTNILKKKMAKDTLIEEIDKLEKTKLIKSTYHGNVRLLKFNKIKDKKRTNPMKANKVKPTVNFFTDSDAEEIISKFNEASSITARKIVIGNNLLFQVRDNPTSSIKILKFLQNCITEYDDSELIQQLTESFWHIVRNAYLSNIEDVIDQSEKLGDDKNFIKRLKEFVLNKDTNTGNMRYSCSKLLVALNPQIALYTLFDALKSLPIFVYPTGYAELIIEAYETSDNDRKQIIQKCEEIAEGNYDEDKKQVARIVIEKL